MKYGDFTLGQVEAVFNKLGGKTGVEKFLRGELKLSESTRCWRKEDGVIYFTVTSNGTTGSQWIERLEKQGFQVSKWAKDVLNSPDFKPTSGVTTEVAILPGTMFTDDDRVTKKICIEAESRKLVKPNTEIGCLIREKLSDKDIEEMDLWWIMVFHEPIKDSDGDPSLLAVSRFGDGLWLVAYCDRSGGRWYSSGGFAFALSQV